MNRIRWILAALFVLGLAKLIGGQTVSRTYWIVPLDSLAVGHTSHTHAAVTGRVAYVRHEDDGDTHIKLVSPAGKFIIAECIPLLPCSLPKLGTLITVRGITRKDPEHLWWEVHPVESWVLIQ